MTVTPIAVGARSIGSFHIEKTSRSPSLSTTNTQTSSSSDERVTIPDPGVFDKTGDGKVDVQDAVYNRLVSEGVVAAKDPQIEYLKRLGVSVLYLGDSHPIDNADAKVSVNA